MKKNLQKILVICILLVSIFNFSKISNVKADSGWDSSYSHSSSHSSSHRSSSHSYHSSSSSHRSSSNVKSNPKATLIILSIFIFIMLYIIYIKINYKKSLLLLIVSLGIWIGLISIMGISKMAFICAFTFAILIFIFPVMLCLPSNSFRKTNNRKDINEEELNKYIDISLNSLKEELYNKFIKIQEAWMNFDYDTLKKLCNNEIYNTYYEELEALKLKSGKNIMSKFDLLENKIIGITKVENNIIITYYLNVAFFDYVINTETNRVIKGYKSRKINNQYELKYIFSKKTINNCPNCGGSIEPGTTTCEHCKAVIVQDSNEFVMSSKRRV